MSQENVSPEQAEWIAQYEFWTRIISDEVARLRWNEGFEPLECDLYELGAAPHRPSTYYGKTKICGRDFCVTATERTDFDGRKFLQVSIRVQTRKHH